MRIIRTKNSVYEVDLANERVRRTEGANPPAWHVEDGEWVPYVEYKKVGVGLADDPFSYIFFLPNGLPYAWIITSQVISEHDQEEIDL